MIEPAVVAAVGVVGGGILAVSARDGRVVAIGLLIAMVAAPLVAAPLPESLSVGARILGAVLAAYLLWAPARGSRTNSAGSTIGLAAETAIAAAAVAIGLSVTMVDPLPGPTVAQAAGLALIVLAVVPLAGRDVRRLGTGVTLLVLAASLLTAAWLGSTPPLAHLAIATLLVGIAGASSVAIGRQPFLDVDTTDAKSAALAAASGIESTGGPARAGSLAAAGGSRVAAASEAIGTVRARTTRFRDRSKSPSEQTSAWAQTEQGELDAVPPETPSPLPATRPVRPSNRSQP
jgi:hypothetical protein